MNRRSGPLTRNIPSIVTRQRRRAKRAPTILPLRRLELFTKKVNHSIRAEATPAFARWAFPIAATLKRDTAKNVNPQIASDLVGRVRAAIIWSAARSRFARGEFREALRLVRSLSPDPMRPLHWHAFEILQTTLLKKHTTTLREVQHLLKVRAANELSPDERYLLCFAQWCGRYAFSQLSPGTEPPALLLSDFRSVDLRDVSHLWRRLFPLHAHPGWVVRWAGWPWQHTEGQPP